jgi:concanavalin A-like lectin/glucanase superfamily protein/F5/8 type C domain-containing protein
MCKRWLCCVVVIALVLAGIASADLVGHWRLDDGAGTVASDSSGNGHDGELIGSPQWVEGVYGGALQLAGTPDKVDIPYSEQLNPQDEFSASVWANLDPAGSDYRSPITSRDDYPQRGYIIYCEPGNTWQFWTGTGAGWDNTAGPAANLGEWTHLVATFANGDKKLYVNGELVVEGNAALGPNTAQVLRIGAGATEGDGAYFFVGLIDDVAVFDHALTATEVLGVMAGIASDEIAASPSPNDGAVDLPRETILAWEPGVVAATHDVYLGTMFDDVNDASRANPMDVLISQGQTDATCDPGRLEFGQTYFWRVDEVNAAPDNTIFKGDVWSFTVEPLAYPIEGITATSNGSSEAGVGPENTVNGSGLNASDQHSTESTDMWLASPVDADPITIEYAFDGVYKLHEMLVWNYNVQFELLLGFGIKNVTVEYSEDGATWMSLGDVELAQATAKADYTANTTVDMGGVAARYVRLTVNSGFSMIGQYGLSEVRFLSIPVQASEPQPADGTVDVGVTTALSWRAGREAGTHDVYLGTDAEALALAASVNESSYAPAELQFGSTYFWKIDEVNEAEAIASWESALWSFSTEAFAIFEDFESYDDEDNRIYDTWLDGWVNETGSTVGYLEEPFAEQVIVNNGAQSMPLIYDNSIAPFYAEVEKDLGGMSLTGNGADTLVVNFRGSAPGFFEADDGRILVNSLGADVWGTADEFRYVYKRLSGDGSIVARVDVLTNTSLWAKAGVMIREGLDAGSSHAITVVTPGNGVAFQNRPVMNQDSFGINETGLVTPYWVKLTRAGTSFTAERSEDGVNWVSITDDAAASTVEIEMSADVYIGLMAGSVNASSVGAATFSNVTTTGNVTGAWETVGVGLEQPAGNTPEAVYVALEDSAGNVQVVTHPDVLATALAEWQQWEIPFSALDGVNLGSIRTIYVGVGDRDNPSAGGTGVIYVDDIGFGRPAAVAQ